MLFDSGYSESEQKLEGLSGWKQLLTKDMSRITSADAELDGRRASNATAQSGKVASEASLPDELGKPGKAPIPLVDERQGREPQDNGIRYILVKDDSLLTYRAVLMWLLSDKISFSILDDLGAPACLATSSKAVYALALKLEISSLQSIALADHKQKLTARNAMKELFSSHALLYPSLKDAAMTAAIILWKTIKADKGHLYYRTMVDSGAEDPALLAEVMEELLGRV